MRPPRLSASPLMILSFRQRSRSRFLREGRRRFTLGSSVRRLIEIGLRGEGETSLNGAHLAKVISGNKTSPYIGEVIFDTKLLPTSGGQASPSIMCTNRPSKEECVMTRWMNGGEIERLAMLTNWECPQCRSDTPKRRPVTAKTESVGTVSIFMPPEGWLDRIQVGFPRANWW